ncbi:MAG: hypothetical protein ABIA74_04160 [bacterium]
MNYIDKIANYIQRLNKKEFEKFLLIILSSLSITILGTIYFIYIQSKALTETIKNTEKLSNNATNLLNENKKMDFEENRLTRILEANKNLSIKTFFEQLTQQQAMIPEPTWDTITVPVEGNDKFEEIILSANFKNQTTQNLTRMLDVLEKNEIIYIKELIINHEADQKISFKITIATKRSKTF